MVLIEVVDSRSGRTRRCDARCHRADPALAATSACVCGGVMRGVDPAAVSPERLDEVRRGLVLGEFEHVQLRIGA